MICRFPRYQMKASPDRFHLIDSCDNEISICVNGFDIINSKCVKLLGIKTDDELNFNTHVDDIWEKARQKLNRLWRVTPCMALSKRIMLVNAFFLSQFCYCPLVWMCCSRIKNNRINTVALRCQCFLLHFRVFFLVFFESFLPIFNKKFPSPFFQCFLPRFFSVSFRFFVMNFLPIFYNKFPSYFS